MRRVAFAFLAGFLGTIAFHQIALELLHLGHLAPFGAGATKPVPPFGVPAVISLAFWGGGWGVVMMPVIDRRRGAAYWLIAIIFGAIAPTLVAWFVVAPLKHQPMAGGFKPRMLMLGPIVNGAWGLGTAAFYRLFVRR